MFNRVFVKGSYGTQLCCAGYIDKSQRKLFGAYKELWHYKPCAYELGIYDSYDTFDNKIVAYRDGLAYLYLWGK